MCLGQFSMLTCQQGLLKVWGTHMRSGEACEQASHDQGQGAFQTQKKFRCPLYPHSTACPEVRDSSQLTCVPNACSESFAMFHLPVSIS